MALILIIDDDDNFCGTMKSLVLRMGHDFLAAGTLEQGIQILGEQAVDILLLDVGLPDGNELEALSRIKRHPNPALKYLSSRAWAIRPGPKPPSPKRFGTILSNPPPSRRSGPVSSGH